MCNANHSRVYDQFSNVKNYKSDLSIDKLESRAEFTFTKHFNTYESQIFNYHT